MDKPRRTKTAGRPPMGKREAMSFRITPELRDRLGALAAQNHRSRAEEVEHRLELSVAETDLMAKYLGGPDLVLLAKMVVTAVQAIPAYDGTPWNQSPTTIKATSDVLIALF